MVSPALRKLVTGSRRSSSWPEKLVVLCCRFLCNDRHWIQPLSLRLTAGWSRSNRLGPNTKT